ncbi:MAG TPA: T9SS type A sorting domain-containing protein [Ignavibacteria bacterium]|nr:T9SS type A sorting domain-containing protein [Ignavibacteria bacterium]
MKILLIVFVLMLTSVESKSQGYLNFPLDTIVSDEFYNYRNMAKFDANGKIHMVNTRQFHTNSATREIFYRNNVSGSFVTTRLTHNNTDDNYASFGFDSQGFVHIGWEQRDAGNLFQLIYKNNRGGTFGDSVWITSGGVNKATPFMAVGKDSLVHFVYYTYSTGNNNAYYRNYNFITNQLGPEVFLSAAMTGSENDIEVAVDNNNKIHIIYCTNVNINGGALRYWTNESGTLTEIPTGISANGEYPDITIDNGNEIHIVYRLATDKRIYVLRRLSGGNFQTPLAISPSSIGNPSYWRSIDTDDKGTLFVTYQNSTNPAPRGFFLIHVIGNNVSQPILVFEDSTASYIGRGSSSVAARKEGELAVTFDPTASRNGNVASDIFLKKGTLIVTDIKNPSIPIPKGYVLNQNYPNPFNPSTKISFEIPEASIIELKIFSSIGNEVMSVINNEKKQKGFYEYNINFSDLTTGIYFYRLTAISDNNIKTEITKKLIFMK